MAALHITDIESAIHWRRVPSPARKAEAGSGQRVVQHLDPVPHRLFGATLQVLDAADGCLRRTACFTIYALGAWTQNDAPPEVTVELWRASAYIAVKRPPWRQTMSRPVARPMQGNTFDKGLP